LGILVISEWIVKEGKQQEFMEVWQKFLDYYDRNAEEWQKMKLIKLYSRNFGGTYGAYVELNEYDSLSDYEELMAIGMSDEEWVGLFEEFVKLIENGSITSKVLNHIA
jgi:hypothetical protein